MFAVWQVHVADEILRTISEIIDQDIIVLKGIAAAGHYPDRALRPFGDLDLFAADPVRAQRQLLAAGFRRVAGFEEGFFDGHHHLEPLELPGRETLKVEIHSRAPWVNWCPSPSFGELRGRGRPGPAPAIWLPDPIDHALILACHSWHSLPLRRALDLVDIALVADGVDRQALAQLARRRRVSRLWKTTLAASDALMSRGSDPLPLRIWARDLRAVRECSLIERHLRTWLAPFWARPPQFAALEALHAIALDVLPTGGETWPEKLERTRRGVQHPLRPIRDHDKALGPSARRLRPRDGRSSGPTEASVPEARQIG
ncbi:MAG TPA: nucleotidyltransferase family protein [Solirubrobacteraceae bacterium]|nr:nucleotidyltransferase family protein [Solirubrobacteraceae bacterium]